MRYESYEVASDLCCTASPFFVGSAKALPWQWIKIISRTGNCTCYKRSQFYAQMKSIKIVIRSHWLRYFRSSFGSHQPGFSKSNCHLIMSPLVGNPVMQITYQDSQYPTWYVEHSVAPDLTQIIVHHFVSATELPKPGTKHWYTRTSKQWCPVKITLAYLLWQLTVVLKLQNPYWIGASKCVKGKLSL
jgi:hypothetical protein